MSVTASDRFQLEVTKNLRSVARMVHVELAPLGTETMSPGPRGTASSRPRARASEGHPFRDRFAACCCRRVEPAQIVEVGTQRIAGFVGEAGAELVFDGWPVLRPQVVEIRGGEEVGGDSHLGGFENADRGTAGDLDRPTVGDGKRARIGARCATPGQ